MIVVAPILSIHRDAIPTPAYGTFQLSLTRKCDIGTHGRQTSLKSGGAEQISQTYFVKSLRVNDYETTKHPNFRDFETKTKKSAGTPEPPAPPLVWRHWIYSYS